MPPSPAKAQCPKNNYREPTQGQYAKYRQCKSHRQITARGKAMPEQYRGHSVYPPSTIIAGKVQGEANSVPALQPHAVVMHDALRYKPETMRRWIDEDNKGIDIMGIRWLLSGNRSGKTASSLVIYMKSASDMDKLRMGRRLFHTTQYDWYRPRRCSGVDLCERRCHQRV